MDGQRFKYHERPKEADGLFRDSGGQIYQMPRYLAALEKSRFDSKSLTDTDLAVIESFGGTAEADRAADARRKALQPPQEPARASAPAALSIVDITDAIIKAYTDTPDPNFDRDKYAASVRAHFPGDAPIAVGVYDRVKYLVALKQFEQAPSGLTAGDLEQLAIVDPELGEQARAARVGFVDPHDNKTVEPETKYAPIGWGALAAVTDQILDTFTSFTKTLRVKVREAHARIDALERRLSDPADRASKMADAAGELAALKSRIQGLEERQHLAYRGVWKAEQTYEPGALVTHAGGLWISHATITKAVPGGILESSRAWQLIAKGRA